MAKKRWLLRGVFLLPLLLAAAGWLWSGTHWGYVEYVHEGRGVWCWSEQGVLYAGLWRGVSTASGWHVGVDPLDPARYWPESDPQSWLGFEHVSGPDWDRYWVTVPYWFVLLASGGVLAVVWRLTRAKPLAGRGFPVQVHARS